MLSCAVVAACNALKMCSTDLASRQPNNVAILSNLAEVKLARQDWAGAQEIGEAVKKLGSNNAVADQILGAAFGGEQKYDQSIAAFQNAVAAAPSAVQPMVALVREYVQAKQPDKAIDFLQSVLKSNPANAEALVLLGSVQLANNAPDQAVKSFTTAIDKQPKDIVGYRALGRSLHQTEKHGCRVNDHPSRLETAARQRGPAHVSGWAHGAERKLRGCNL